MRTSGLAWAALLFGACAGLLGAPRGTADDGPGLAAKPKTDPPPKKAETSDGTGAPEASDLEAWLVSDDPVERRRGEGYLDHASPEVLRQVLLSLRNRIAKPLAGWKPPTDIGIASEIRVLELPPCLACTLFRLDSCASAPTSVVLSPSEADALSKSMASRDGTTVLTSSKVSIYDGQRATMEVLQRTSYISDLDIEVAQSPATLPSRGKALDPVIASAIDGVMLNFVGKTSDDHTSVYLSLDLELRRLVRPIAEEKIEKVTLSGEKVSAVLQRPELVGNRWMKTVTVPSGQQVLVALPAGLWPSEQKDRVLALLLSASVFKFETVGGAVIDLVPSQFVPLADVEADLAKAAIQTTLETKRVKGAQFTDASLFDVSSYLRTVTGLEVRLSTAVNGSPVMSSKINTPALADVSALELLNLVIVPLGLSWEARDGGITIVVASQNPSTEAPSLPPPGTKPPDGR